MNNFLFNQEENSVNNHFVFWLISPFILIGYFITLGLTSDLSNTFAGLIILMGIFLLGKQNRSNFPKPYWVMLFLGLMLFLMAVSHVIYSNDFDMFFKFQFDTLKNMLALPFIAAVIVNMKPSFQSVWRIIVLSAVYTLIYSILVIIESPARGQGLLDEPIVIGNLGMMFGLLSLVAILGLNGRYWKLLALVTFLSGFTLSILSGTRAGWTAVVVTGLLFLWVFYSFDRKKFLVSLAAILLVILGVVVFWNALPIEARIIQASNDIKSYLDGISNTSVGSRLDMWQVGLTAFIDKPIFGWGTIPFRETFVAYTMQGVGHYNLNINPRGFAQPHNDYVFMLGILHFCYR